MAEWLTADDNPLFARVMVNRIWSWLMGRGIVETVDNFGVNGQRPSHPELLDWLAIRFKSNGYSVKKTIKDIMLSRAYQLASTFDARNFDKDPGNIHYWRKSQRRLQAEEIRDAMEAWELSFSLGNVVKYISRAGHKDPSKRMEDLLKARWYLEREIERLGGGDER